MGTGAQRRHLGAFAAAVLVVPAALLAAGCGSSSNSSSSSSAPAKVSAAELTRAADVSTKVAGFKTVMSVAESIPGAGKITMTGNGSFQASRVGSMTINMSMPAAASAGLGNLTMTLILDHDAMYMKMPASLTSKLPGGKSWIEIDLAKLKGAAGGTGLSSLMSGDNQMTDPGQYFDYLRAVSSGSLQDLGSATVNGVQTTHYRAAVDLSKLVDAVPAAERAAMAKALALMEKATSGATMPIDVWIDSNHLVRRIVLTETMSVAGKTETVDLQEDFPEYGPQPAPAIPPASQVTNLSALGAI